MLLAGVEPRPRLALPATPPAQLPESAQIRSSSHHEAFQGIILHGRRAVSVNFVVLTLDRFVLCRVRRRRHWTKILGYLTSGDVLPILPLNRLHLVLES